MWHASLAARRLVQVWLELQAEHRSGRGALRDQRSCYVPYPMPLAFQIARCTLEGGARHWFTRCRVCRERCMVLELVGMEWQCIDCRPPGNDLMRAVGEYAFALRIGLVYTRLNQRRQTLAREIRRAGLSARGPGALVDVAVAAAVVSVAPMKHRHWLPRARGVERSLPPGRGGVWRALRPHFLAAFVDQLLHPDAYRLRVLRGA